MVEEQMISSRTASRHMILPRGGQKAGESTACWSLHLMSHLVSTVWFWIHLLHIDFVINLISFNSLQAMLYTSLTIFLVEETVSKSELSRMDAAVPEGTVVGESGVSDGDSAGEAAAPNPVSMHLVEPELESD